MANLAKLERTPEQILADHLDSWEAHVSAWISRREDLTRNQFVMGLIASSVDTRYGEASLQQFAREVGESASTVWRYRNVYRRWFEFSQRCENLSWSHFLIVTEAKLDGSDGEAILERASEDSWSVKQLKRAIGVERTTKALSNDIPYLDPQMAAAISHWRELKPSIERFAAANPQISLYARDFMSDVDEALEQPWDSGREYIERLIYAGCREVEALAIASRWKRETVQRLCESLVEAGAHEWRDQGGKTEDARGARRQLIVPVKEPSGEAYQGSRYGMLVDGDDDE